MKIIDEKGRLFGKINVIDFLVLIFLFSLVPMFYFGYKFLNTPEKLKEEKKELINVELNCKLIRLGPKLLKVISIGDKELDEDSRVIAEILNIGNEEPLKYEFDIGNKEIIYHEDQELKQVLTKMRITAAVKGDTLYYKDKKISLNSVFEFKTDKYSVNAVVASDKKTKKQLKEVWVQLKVKFTDIIPELSAAIKEKDKEVDPEGKVVANLNTILTNKSADILTMTLKENKVVYVSGTHPVFKEIIALLSVLCIDKEGTLYFKNYPVKIGNSITFTTDSYAVSGTIIGLEIK